MMRLLGLLVQLLAFLGLVASIAGAACVWVYHPKLELGWNRLATRGDVALTQVRKTLGDADALLERAGEHLAEFKKPGMVSDAPPEKKDALRTGLLKMVVESLAPQIGDVGPVLLTFNDAAAIASSILQDLEVMPGGAVPFLDRAQIRLASDRVTGLANSTKNLARLLGESNRDVTQETEQVEQALAAVQTVVTDYKSQADDLRSRFDAARRRVDLGLKIAPWGLTFLFAWFGISQISLWMHARRWGE